MQFIQEASAGRYSIRSYGPGEISVLRTVDSGVETAHETLAQSLILTPTHLIRAWPPQQFDQLAAMHFDIFDELRPDVLLLGCGARQRFLPADLRLLLAQRGINVELMNTGAACRTYNILLGDERNVAAALLMI
ncbi:MAG: MTH938/NDUFAF3 family protein [Proteobacteria bacterium]|nr:MTH938/NDUFAF3 family protein [Pseudomonadota bacterium]